ncbi:unnamed protein product [Coffea canephora]|uniref:Uncharacterized protein n=1 Tax=Coffea canephora TaxID=49390 RepID=A0A068UQ01_COFCA|nr:unnamed protein product [Coffea canephora]
MLNIGVQVSECDSFCFIPIFSVASICYAHLAASQLGQWMKFEDTPEISSSHGEVSHAESHLVPELPRRKENVCNSMFFC